jgi:hypothetical protein
MFCLNSNSISRLITASLLSVLSLFIISSMFLASPKTAEGASCADMSELLQNGDFEFPVVTKGYGWDIYPNGTPGLGWNVQWLSNTPSTFNGGNGTDTRPTLGQLEIAKKGFEGFDPSSGNQWAELDSDWSGPDMVGEPASIRIFQDIQTVPGRTYTLAFDFSPRPSAPPASENVLVVNWDGQVIDTIATSSINNNQTQWTRHEYILMATSNNTRVQFSDGGTPNSYGTYIDNVSLKCENDGTLNPTSSVTVIKEVINDNGGTSTASDFTMQITGTNVSTSTFQGSATGTVVTLSPGAYSVDEATSTQYAKTLSADCSGSILAGQNKTCTITNNDIATTTGSSGTSTLTVIKNVINDNNGTSTASNFIIMVMGTNVSTSTFPGSATGTVVTLDSGSYSVDEVTSTDQYTKTLSADCSGNIGAGENKTCTITNDDTATTTPPNPTYPCADFNNDGVVNQADVDIAQANSGKTPATFEDGDVNGNGIVNATDISITKSQLGRVCRGGGGGGDDDDGRSGGRRRSSSSSSDPATLSCSPASQNALVGQPLTFTANGGEGDYTWTAGGGFMRNGNQTDNNTLSGSYSDSGSKIVTVTDEDGETATCAVTIAVAEVLGATDVDVPGFPTTGASGNILNYMALILGSMFVTIGSLTLLKIRHS